MIRRVDTPLMPSHIHRSHQTGRLRAAVLGANDGVLSISSLLLGVASAHASSHSTVLAGLAGLVGGALSMGAGEYVSVSSQADTERADLEVERQALRRDAQAELLELRDIYMRRGVDEDLATRVSQQLMAHDALGAHARDDIGITEALMARPLQAAGTSSISFFIGGCVPCLTVIVCPREISIACVATVSLASLAALGAIAAKAGGAPMRRGAWRVFVWSALAMAVTSGMGAAASRHWGF